MTQILPQGRLSIVPLTLTHYPQMAKWLTDDRVLQFYEGRDNPYNLQKIAEKFDPLVMGTAHTIPCIIALNNNPIGYIQYYTIAQEEWAELQVTAYNCPYGTDLFIGEAACRNNGLGSSILRLLCGYLFNTLHADVVVGDPQTRNPRSISAFASAGFTQICILPAHELHEDSMEDNAIMHCTPQSLPHH